MDLTLNQLFGFKETVKKYIEQRSQISNWDSLILWELLKQLIDTRGTIEIPRVKQVLSAQLQTHNMTDLDAPKPEAKPLDFSKLELLLLNGDLQTARRLAIESQEWAHALMLGKALDETTYQETLASFAKQSFSLGSPTQTFCLAQANKIQEILQDKTNNLDHIKSLTNDWQRTLLMILSNPQGECLRQFGDNLWILEKKVEAAHVCYLTMGRDFGYFDDPHTRIALVGADHRTSSSFVTFESLARTEIFEFAKMLANSQFSIPKIQPYKFIHAQLLAEMGQLDKANQ